MDPPKFSSFFSCYLSYEYFYELKINEMFLFSVFNLYYILLKSDFIYAD